MVLRALLRQRRIELGLSTSEVVERVRKSAPHLRGFHTSTLSWWESDTSPRSPSAEQLVAWAAALGLTVELRPARAKAA